MRCRFLTLELEYLIRISLYLTQHMYLKVVPYVPRETFTSCYSGFSELACPTSWFRKHTVVFSRIVHYKICDGAYFLLGIGWSATHLAAGFQLIM